MKRRASPSGIPWMPAVTTRERCRGLPLDSIQSKTYFAHQSFFLPIPNSSGPPAEIGHVTWNYATANLVSGIRWVAGIVHLRCGVTLFNSSSTSYQPRAIGCSAVTVATRPSRQLDSVRHCFLRIQTRWPINVPASMSSVPMRCFGNRKNLRALEKLLGPATRHQRLAEENLR